LRWGRGAATHGAAVVVGFTVGAVAGYAGAGGSTNAPGAATATVTVSSGGTKTSPTGKSDTTQRQRPGEIPGDGTYVVGQDIRPGTYRTDGPQGGLITDCYWARLSSTSGNSQDIIANGDTKGQTAVTIASTDKAFTTRGCKPWKKVG